MAVGGNPNCQFLPSGARRHDDTTTERRQPESNKVKATELPRQQESQRNRFGQRSGHGFLAYSR